MYQDKDGQGLYVLNSSITNVNQTIKCDVCDELNIN